MLEYVIVLVVALGASMLTFFSGFGLGTLLTPALILVLPAELAVAATAIVHFLNNLFKLTLIGKHISWRVVLKFGIPAIIGAFFGAKLLALLAVRDAPLHVLGTTTSALNIVLGLLILFFALFELIPKLKSLQLNQRWLLLGGSISGFFGGLSGHQGALRSAFLVKLGLKKESFIATGVMIACMIDSIRITTYVSSFDMGKVQAHWPLITLATLFAFLGAIIGKRLLTKVTIDLLQNVLGILMIIIAILLFLGKV